MQVMQLAKHLLLLAAALTASDAGRAAAQGQFDSVPANSSCAARTVSVAARGDIECAVRSSQAESSSSFSFINGVCVLSDSADCAVSGAASVFRKRVSATAAPSVPGYVQQIDGRQFWVFQQRQTGQVAFNRTWVEYELGFGNGSEFWAGLQQIHSFTESHTNTLRIELTAVNGSLYVGEWLNFTVAGASTNYTMNCGAFLISSSNISIDVMDPHRGMQFSTIDADNDVRVGVSCSQTFGGGGFWFASCMSINPNGLYSSMIESDVSQFIFCFCFTFGGRNFRAIRMMLQT